MVFVGSRQLSTFDGLLFGCRLCCFDGFRRQSAVGSKQLSTVGGLLFILGLAAVMVFVGRKQ